MDDAREYIEELIGDVNTDEPGIGGTVKAGDFEGAKDQTNDAHLYLDRFSAFIQMLYKLEENYGIQYSLTLKTLPEVEGFTKHLKPIIIHAVLLKCISYIRVSISFYWKLIHPIMQHAFRHNY